MNIVVQTQIINCHRMPRNGTRYNHRINQAKKEHDYVVIRSQTISSIDSVKVAKSTVFRIYIDFVKVTFKVP